MEPGNVRSRVPLRAHLDGCVGFWLWAIVGGAVAFGFISFIGWLVIVPGVGLAYLLKRRSVWSEDAVQLGLVAGAGLPLLLVAGLQWTDWHHRTLGDNTPNPYYWGGAGLILLFAGIAAYALRRSSGRWPRSAS
jgi:hypothetical protein